MNRGEFDAKQDVEKIEQAMQQCAVIQFESGAYFRAFYGNFTRVNLLADATMFVIGGPSLAEWQKRLTIRGEYFQVVILGRVGALP